jgi:putative membrane protein
MDDAPKSAIVASESLQVRLIVFALSGAVFLLVLLSVYFLPAGGAVERPSALATLNAVLNGAASVLLTLGYIFVRRRNLVWHRRAMLGAFGVSSLFLLTYLLHHSRVGSVPFLGQGWVRTLYFALLIPHILLAAVVVPLALLTAYRGWTNRLEAHRAIARVTFPLWLFVSVSGVVVYFMLYHL